MPTAQFLLWKISSDKFAIPPPVPPYTSPSIWDRVEILLIQNLKNSSLERTSFLFKWKFIKDQGVHSFYEDIWVVIMIVGFRGILMQLGDLLQAWQNIFVLGKFMFKLFVEEFKILINNYVITYAKYIVNIIIICHTIWTYSKFFYKGFIIEYSNYKLVMNMLKTVL